uniref:Uncharacterized protein n=1 Tax=Heterorhabditis bacteriophora TaxID=37862 RepID=A0A1I7W5Z7_HETBA
MRNKGISKNIIFLEDKRILLCSCTKTKDDGPSFVTLLCECFCLRSNYNYLSVSDFDSGKSTI